MANKSRVSNQPARVVLDGVRRVGFGIIEPNRDAEGCPFPSCLSACLEFIGEDYGYTEVELAGSTWRDDNAYIHLMGTSGCAFRLNWKPGWHLDNVAISYMSDDPIAPFRRAFEAVGYKYEIASSEEGRDNEAYFRRRIIESIGDRRRPVLYFGVIGPPECCIVAGYDEDGDVLIGWNYFQSIPEFSAGVEFEPSGYFRKRDWFGGTHDWLILIGDKQERPAPSEVYRDALNWALNVARTPLTFGDRHNGFAAYAAWADALAGDDDFPAEDTAILRERLMVHNDAVGMIAEGRWYASQFVKQAAEHEPAMAGDLLTAATCYKEQHDLMWEVWNLVGGIGFSDEHAKKLAEPAVRRGMIPIILQAQHKDSEAAGHIERALAL
ncbi:MAG: hypothetical protein JSV86_11080 [Gemmatimonadota bacterium]|nr:MAG: hypothetical protein JSV86_11080 [Gemmatimonadota bacterium]